VFQLLLEEPQGSITRSAGWYSGNPVRKTPKEWVKIPSLHGISGDIRFSIGIQGPGFAMAQLAGLQTGSLQDSKLCKHVTTQGCTVACSGSRPGELLVSLYPGLRGRTPPIRKQYPLSRDLPLVPKGTSRLLRQPRRLRGASAPVVARSGFAVSGPTGAG